MKRLHERDQRLVSRFVDGELDGDELAAFERRCLQDPDLRASVEEQRATRSWFVGADDGIVASAGFVNGVLKEARRLPSRDALANEAAVLGEDERDEQRLLRLGRFLMVAAAVIVAAALMVGASLLKGSDSRYLDASDRQRIERIDLEREAALRGEQAEPGIR